MSSTDINTFLLRQCTGCCKHHYGREQVLHRPSILYPLKTNDGRASVFFLLSWHLAFGIWHLVFGIWYLVFGIWYLALATIIKCYRWGAHWKMQLNPAGLMVMHIQEIS